MPILIIYLSGTPSHGLCQQYYKYQLCSTHEYTNYLWYYMCNVFLNALPALSYQESGNNLLFMRVTANDTSMNFCSAAMTFVFLSISSKHIFFKVMTESDSYNLIFLY